MAHVLLPCDLPAWGDVQKLMAQVRSCKTAAEVAQIMAQVHEMCSVSLDPEDSAPIQGHPGFKTLSAFLGPDHFPALCAIAEWASRLPALRPSDGLHFSLRTEEMALSLDRGFVASLLANSFFCTFPRRKVKTHPTLQDFNMADFFACLERESHQQRLYAFLHYFEDLEPEPDGSIQFIRKIFRGPTLPGWLCSEQPLVPLVVRPQGTMDEAEPWVFRGRSCCASVGGNVLTESTSQESGLFFDCPELLSALCFLESLVEQEALIVEGVRTPNTQEVSYCFLDAMTDGQPLDDRGLLLSLNKAVAAFAHEPRRVDRRSTPDGGESSEEQHSEMIGEAMKIPTAADLLRRFPDCPKVLPARKLKDKSLSQASSKYSMRTASESSSKLDDEYYTADEDSESESSASRPLPPSTSSLRSLGFVLQQHSDEEGDDDEEDSSLGPRHERLEDFRRRIRRRTRGRSRRHHRSYSSGNSSSDMEDIDEEEAHPLLPLVTVRPACSEPSLVNLPDSATEVPPWVSPEAVLSLTGQKHLVATCSGGLKAYSHDGVRPNLPVPFRARFRVRRRSDEDDSRGRCRSTGEDDKEWTSRCPVAVSGRGAGGEGDPQLRVLVLWLAASMAQLPALILYTMEEPALKEVVRVYRQVLDRSWSVGDLACEVLRFCRNRIAPGHRAGKYPNVFEQLTADASADKKIFADESLD